MNVVVRSRILGTFLGYAPGVVHRLDDGSEWEQIGNMLEYVYRERPACRNEAQTGSWRPYAHARQPGRHSWPWSRPAHWPYRRCTTSLPQPRSSSSSREDRRR